MIFNWFIGNPLIPDGEGGDGVGFRRILGDYGSKFSTITLIVRSFPSVLHLSHPNF